MDLSGYWQIIILCSLLVISAFFASSETALMSLSKIRLRHLMEEEVKGADLVYKLVEKPAKLIGAILVGNTASNIAISALATSIAIEMFGSKGVAISIVVTTVIILIFVEITPKAFAAQYSESMSLKFSKLISFLVMILNPIVIILNYVTNIIIKMFGGKINSHQPFITEEELKTMVDVSHEEGVLEIGEREMIYNVFEFGDLQAKDVMIQRTDVIAIDKISTYDEIVEIFKEERFSRMPVYEESIDDIIGILNVKDLVFV